MTIRILLGFVAFGAFASPSVTSACVAGHDAAAAEIAHLRKVSQQVEGRLIISRQIKETVALPAGLIGERKWSFGRIETTSGDSFAVYFDEVWPSSCPDPHRPAGDAKGIFYLREGAASGQFYLYDWDDGEFASLNELKVQND